MTLSLALTVMPILLTLTRAQIIFRDRFHTDPPVLGRSGCFREVWLEITVKKSFSGYFPSKSHCEHFRN